jgi:SNF2 domain-containing protein/helicase-like protein
MTLQGVSHLKDPSERVPLGERMPYEEGLKLIESGAFEGYELKSVEPGIMSLLLFWNHARKSTVRIVEEKPQGVLNFSCSECLENGRSATTCAHQWASFVLLWQTTTMEAEDLQHPDLKLLAAEIKGPDFLGAFENPRYHDAAFAGVMLESLSLVLDEAPMLKGPALGSLLELHFGKYKLIEVEKGKELLSPRLWNLPEVFRKKLSAFSEHYFNEVNKQNRMADMVRYNFSNGLQISAREILRHPLQRMVPGELLPQAKLPTSVFVQWPLIQQSGAGFISQALHELEEIMQALLANIVSHHNRRKVDLYLQAKTHPNKALKLQSVEFHPANEVDWRVDFRERRELEAEFKLVSFRKQPLYFFESFAVEATEGVILVHPWMRELSQLQETLSAISEEFLLPEGRMPSVDLVGEVEIKTLLKYLRTRSIPVKIEGESRTLQSHQSLIEIRLDESGQFYIQHQARVNGQKDLVRRGWSSKMVVYLQALSQGLPYLFNVEAKDLATRVRTKREWDMKLLKHLGILQYVLLEALSLHFDGHLTDGSLVKKEDLFFTLHERLKALLIAGTGGVFVRDLALAELCSRPVLACFEDFVQLTYKTLSQSEAFYSENGEVILEGVIEREFRLLYEILRRMALVTGGEVFKKSRTSLLGKISNQETAKDQPWEELLFHFPVADADKKNGGVHGALEVLQTLIPRGYKLYYKDQPLQELEDDEFHVDFLLQAEGGQKNFNWFELNPKFFLRGEEVDPDRFLSLGSGGVIEYEGRLFLVPQKQMPSLRRLENFWQKLQKGRVENSKRKSGDKVYHLPRHQTLELLALRASGIGMRGDEEWQKLCAFYDNLGNSSRMLQLPPSMKAELKPYQSRGVLWLQDLYQLRLGALLADDMGLGKTLQTLCFLDDLRDKDEMGQVLVVVPSSLIFNWQSEVEKFTPELPMEVFSNRDMMRIGHRLESKEQLVVITTYGLLMEHEGFLNQYKWKVLIFDEAQNLKNITTKRTSSARSLTAQFKICLTGTPMENHYGEFYSLVDLLVPGSLGKVDDFRRQFVNSEMVTREEMDDLKLKIKPLLLRRTKKEILDQLPEKQETKVSIAFEERQKTIYRDIALSYNQRVQETMAAQGEASVQLQMLTALLRLRQACSDPAALPNVKYEKVPPKLETLMDSVTEIVESGESALVFTQFLQTLDHTVKLLRAAGVPVFALHGGIPTKQRQTILSEFNKVAGGAVLVMTLKTGGVGLNLTKASYVFHLEPWWNPSVENQATDRAHRIGQNKAVQVFRYIMHESLEEKIELLKDRKDRKFQVLFTNSEKEVEVGPGGNALTKADFDLLLGIK